MRKCLCFLFHLLSFPYIFSLFPFLCKSLFPAQPRSYEFCCLQPKGKMIWLERVLDIICKDLVTLLEICPWCMSTIFPLYLFSSYSLNGFGTMILNEKRKKKKLKFDAVHSNTTRIIYKYGMKIDVIIELKM